MKKFVVIFLAVLLVMALAAPAMAAATCYFSGPDTVRAGDTFTVTFYAGGDVTAANGTVVFDDSQLTLQGYTPTMGGTWASEFSGNTFLFYDNSLENPLGSGKALFKATFRVNENLAPGTTVSITATGVTLSNQHGDLYSGSVQWSKDVAEPLSDNADLATLTVSNATITPAFDPAVTEYRTSVPYETSKLQISATAAHSGAKVTVGETYLAANATTDVTVTVTAENGTTKTYHIYATRPQDPNYKPSEISTLESLEVEGFLLSAPFSAEQPDYAVYLPNVVESVRVIAKTTDSKAKVEIPAIENIPVGKTTYEVVVTAENGDIRIYTVTTFRAEPFVGPYADPEPTEPATEPTEPATEPVTEPAEETTEAPTVPTSAASPNSSDSKTGKSALGILWPLSVLAAFLGGFVAPMLLRKKK